MVQYRRAWLGGTALNPHGSDAGWSAFLIRTSRSVVSLCAAAFLGWHAVAAMLALMTPGFLPSDRGVTAHLSIIEPESTAGGSGAGRLWRPIFGRSSTVALPSSQAYWLQGVFSQSNGEGYALIAEKDEPRLFRTGDMLPNGERLLSLDDESVIIEARQGRERIILVQEVPLMPPPAAGLVAERTDVAPVVASDREINVGANDRHIASGLAQAMYKGLHTSPIRMDTGERGLHIDQLLGNPMVRSLGLSPGDVIISINDRPVAGLGVYESLLSNLKGAEELKIEFVRDRQRGSTIIPLPKG